MDKITLPWMNELRRFMQIYRDEKRIIKEMFEYGLDEEERINEKFDEIIINVDGKEGYGMSSMSVELAKSFSDGFRKARREK